MPEEMTQTAVTTAPVTEHIDKEEAISIIASEAVSNAMESAGVTMVSETVSSETAVSESITETEIPAEITENVVTEISTISQTSVETTIESTEVISEETAAETESISVLLPETAAEAVTESTAEVSAVPETVSQIAITPKHILVPLLIAGLGAAAIIVKKKGGKKKAANKKSAKDRDAARLEAAKTGKSKKKGKSVKTEKEKKNLSKRVLDTIPYKKILADNIWYLGRKMYSKAYTFDDINFNLADEEQQYMYLERYIEFMNVLDDTVDCQICLWNSKINMEEFRHRTLMPQRADDFFNLRFEYNTRVLEENIKKGQNAIQKHMYITLTIKAPDEETAARKFKSLDIAAVNSFNRIGNTNMRELTSQERVEMLKDFYIGDETPLPVFTSEDYAKGREKLYCAPDYFDFKKDYFMFNDTYAKTIFICEFPATATSEVISDLLATGIEVMITTNVEAYDTAVARKLVQRQITAIDTDMAKREVAAAQHGNFSSQMPQRIKNQRDSMVSVYDKITTKDQKLFLVNIQILIKAKSYDELINNAEIIESTLKRSGCVKGEMAWQQEDGMCDCLPCGYQRKFGWQRTMPSESVAIFIPFNVKEMQMKNAVYYGLNVLSHNIITFDRMTGLINPSGVVLA
ncbi:MAG: hypothetical protein ACI4JF_10820 [Oscillospiraceae bacterium]